MVAIHRGQWVDRGRPRTEGDGHELTRDDEPRELAGLGERWRDPRERMRGHRPATLLRPTPEDALQERTVSTRVNRAGVGEIDPCQNRPAPGRLCSAA